MALIDEIEAECALPKWRDELKKIPGIWSAIAEEGGDDAEQPASSRSLRSLRRRSDRMFGTIATDSYEGILALQGVPNSGAIIAQIDKAATLATGFMRLNGLVLGPGRDDVPLLDEVDQHLRALVNVAYAQYQGRRGAAVRVAADVERCDGDGRSCDDRYFETTISALPASPAGFLTVSVNFRLV